MSAFAPIPLGQPIPPGPHSVSCSLPTMESVRGYEEKNPAILRHLSSGYPRFVVHPFARQLAAHFGEAGRTLWLTSSERMAGELARHLGSASGAALFARDGLYGASHRKSAEIAAQAKLYLQHLGGFLSSREAEDHLVRLGLRKAAHSEQAFAGDAAAETRRWLRTALPGTADRDLLLANSGMNAVYAVFRAISELQRMRGKTAWVQLGWLYLDTIAILKKFQAGPDDYLYLADPLDGEALDRLFTQHGSRIAGVFAEIPTNPLIQTPDLAALAALCRRHGARLVVDPSVVSVGNVQALPYADVVTSSLTKYTASEGDVIAGAVAINPGCPDAAELRRRTADWLEPVYPRDLARLAAQIGETDAVLARIQKNTPQVAAFLSSHPKIREVFWAHHPASRDHYRKISRTPDAVGGMISFSLRGPLDPFYDRLRLPKGPSFGMKTTLICPFMYLAHYDLVTSPAGRAELARDGLDPELLRLCVGVEPVEDIIAALAEALG